MSVEHHSSMRRPTAGVDWASTEHALAIVNCDGVEVQRMLVEHTAGLRKLLRCLQQAMVLEVGIERPDGPVVEALLRAGLTVFVIAPDQINHLRRRYGAAGNAALDRKSLAALKTPT